jgi:hypothetical protein
MPCQRCKATSDPLTLLPLVFFGRVGLGQRKSLLRYGARDAPRPTNSFRRSTSPSATEKSEDAQQIFETRVSHQLGDRQPVACFRFPLYDGENFMAL